MVVSESEESPGEGFGEDAAHRELSILQMPVLWDDHKGQWQWSQPVPNRQAAYAVNGRAREVQLPKDSRTQKVMRESQTLDIESFT